MSPRAWRLRVEDVIEAIASTQAYVQGLGFEQFAADRKTVRAVAYEMGVIGEATRQIPVAVRQRHPQLPWGKMQSIRNIVVHE